MVKIIKASAKVRGNMKKKILLTFVFAFSQCLVASPVYNFNFYNGENPEVVMPKKVEEKNIEAKQSADETQDSGEEAQPKSTEGFIKATGKVVRGVKEILTPQNRSEFGISYITQELQSSKTNYSYNTGYLTSNSKTIGVTYLTAKKASSVGRHRFGILLSNKQAEYINNNSSDEYNNSSIVLSGVGLSYDYTWYFPVTSGPLSHFIIEQGIAFNYYQGTGNSNESYIENEESSVSRAIQPENMSFSNYNESDDELKVYSGTANLRAGLELAAARLKFAGLIGLGYSHNIKETRIDIESLVKDSELDVSLTLRLGLEL